MKKTFLLLTLALLSVVGAKAENVTISVSTDVAYQGKYYFFYSSDKALDFTEVEGVRAFTVTHKIVDDWYKYGEATLTQVDKVPAATGILIEAASGTDITVPVATGEVPAIEENDLVAVLTETEVSALPEGKVPVFLRVLYGTFIFATDDDVTTLSANSAYLASTGEEIDEIYEEYYGFAYFDTTIPAAPKSGGDEGPVTAANIAALNQLVANATDEAIINLTLDNAKVTYVSGTNVVLEDATGAIVLKETGLEEVVKAGEVYSGEIELAIVDVLYGLVYMLTSSDNTAYGFLLGAELVGTEDITPTVIDENTDDEILENLTWKYVRVNGVTLGEDWGATTVDLSDIDGNTYYIQDDFHAVAESALGALPVETGTTVDVQGFFDASAYDPVFQPTAITTPVTIGEAGVATFSSKNRLDFSASEKIAAYIAKVDGTTVTFEKVTKVPANTGVLLRSVDGSAVTEDISVVAADYSATAGNALKPSDGGSVAGKYILANGANGIGFYKAGDSNSLEAGKAYLDVPADAPLLFIGLDGETIATGISEVSTTASDFVIYNLQGQRVAQPTKGVNIINGKKVVIK